MNPLHFLRMAKWMRHPPSPTRVKLVIGVIVLCLLLAGAEWYFDLSDSLNPNDLRRLSR